MEATESNSFNPFNGLSTVKEIEAKKTQILSLVGNFFQESSNPKKIEELAQKAIQKIQQN